MKKSRLIKYIEINEIPNPDKKTKRFVVLNVQSGNMLGKISWYGGWRKYVYYNETIGYSDWDFLRMIADFCEILTKTHVPSNQ